MALVAYSDSEESDTGEAPKTAVKANVKKLDRTDSKKIRVDLPALQAEPSTGSSEPASKRQRTAGAFSGFNSLLPAPKRAAQSNIKSGFKLKTSSEAAFSRAAPPPVEESGVEREPHVNTSISTSNADVDEPKLVGKATRFLPLSVTKSKKKVSRPGGSKDIKLLSEKTNAGSERLGVAETPAPVVEGKPKPKQSLFSMVEENNMTASEGKAYEPEFTSRPDQYEDEPLLSEDTTHAPHATSNALDDVAADLNLSAAERRRLFGRDAKRADVKITSFDMENEYKANQQLAANGEMTEHRAVKAIAPGKHSLQQLVNNVRGQAEAIEDKWAEGRRNRGEAGSKYGWS